MLAAMNDIFLLKSILQLASQAWDLILLTMTRSFK